MGERVMEDMRMDDRTITNTRMGDRVTEDIIILF
jgi:hypothetical protein